MILIISAIVAFLVGYIAQNLLYTVYVFGAAAAATLIVCPCFGLILTYRFVFLHGLISARIP